MENRTENNDVQRAERAELTQSQLREAIADSPLSLSRLAADAGVDYWRLYRFSNGSRLSHELGRALNDYFARRE